MYIPLSIIDDNCVKVYRPIPLGCADGPLNPNSIFNNINNLPYGITTSSGIKTKVIYLKDKMRI